MTTSIRFAGAGGQGVALAGKILAEAALRSGRTAAFSQLYGPESRGGSSHADVILSDTDVPFPIATHLDILVALTNAALAKNLGGLVQGTVLIVDDHTDASIGPGLDESRRRYPIVDLAKSAGGSAMMTGVVALGVLETTLDLVGPVALRDAVADLVPPAHRQANLRALDAGMDAATVVTR